MMPIPDKIKIISKETQNVFEELLKLLLRKTLRPIVNTKQRNNVVFNSYKCKYERGLSGPNSNDNINKYNYYITHDSLGWSGEILVNFKIVSKCNSNNPKSKSRVSYKDRKQNLLCQYNKFLNYMTNRNINTIINNNKSSNNYTTDVPYTDSFKQLESIGQDILDQTDPCISKSDSAKMSTAHLRINLHRLETNLADLSVDYPDIFDSYLEMLRIINSVPRQKIIWLINLIASLSYQRWEDIQPNKKKSFINILGIDFIEAFNSNTLVTILIQSDNSELILSASYLFPLLKMLFIVFGYSKLIPNLTDIGYDKDSLRKKNDRFKKFLNKNQGAFVRRGVCDDESMYDDSYSEDYIYYTPNNMSDIRTSDYPIPCRTPDPEPLDQSIYDFIKMFGNLYPTLVGLMGGTENFPAEQTVSCLEIPDNYYDLESLIAYLWRYNDYSYCKYLQSIQLKKVKIALNTKINSKVKFLQSM